MGSDVGWPAELPDNQVEIIASTEPDSTGSSLAGLTGITGIKYTDVRWEVGDQLADMSWLASCLSQQEDADIL
jgi:hypothetical protein